MPHPTPPDGRPDDALLGRLSATVAARLGLSIPRKRWGILRKVLLSLGAEFGLPDPVDCANRLLAPEASAGMLQALAERLTVGETYFFRDEAFLADLERHVLAPLIERRRGGEQRLRIMSAGCASGEEAYTLAILLNRLLPDRTGWKVSILGVDVNAQALDKARTGTYTAWSFRRVGERRRDAHFLREHGRRWRIRPELRAMVSFLRLNLAEDRYPSTVNGTAGMDLVLCRNVLMYFVPEAAAEVVGRLRDCLVPGGVLALAASEMILARVPGLEPSGHPGFMVRTDRSPGAGAPVPADVFLSVLPPADLSASAPPPPSLAPAPARAAPAPRPPEGPPSPPPPAAGSLLQAAQEHYSAGRYAAAAAAAEGFASDPASAADADWARAVYILARALANLNEYARADQTVLRAIARDKLNPGLRYLRASILLEEGRKERTSEAKEELRRALYLDPRHAPAHFLLGNIARDEGRRDAARRHFANAREIVRGMAQDQELAETGGMSAGGLAAALDAIANRETHHERRR
ncbi:MAG: CheR family methyltransferase [Thermodesulfobacteriota bacterium]